jgi:GNAT superfamily N-acetyltransferase
MPRLATEGDLPEIIRMGLAFVGAAGLSGDRDSIEETAKLLIQGGGLFIAGDPPCGMAGVLIYDKYFDRTRKAAQELFWWVDPNARKTGVGKRLLSEIESWARENGADTLTMIALDALDGDAVSEMYKAAGYKPLERNYMKVL